MHYTEPLRPRSGAVTTFADGARNAPAAGRNATYGPSSSPRQHSGHATHSSQQTASRSDAVLYTMDTDSKGCVPTHRSMFRLFKRKAPAPQRTHSDAVQARTQGSGVLNTSSDTRTSTSSASDSGGYMRSRKNTREVTLTAQRTRSELAVEGPRVLNASTSGVARQAKATAASASSHQLPGTKTQQQQQQQYQQRTYRADKGTIVQLRSSHEKRIVIPSIEDIHAAALAAESGASSRGVVVSANASSRMVDSTPNLASPHVDTFGTDADINANTDSASGDADADDGIATRDAADSCATGDAASRAGSGSSTKSRQRGPPRKSASASDMTKLLKEIEEEVDQQTVSDDEVLTTNANVAVHVLPDDSSDWNSDFSSPTSWRRPAERTPSRLVTRVFEGSRLKDRAIDRGVLEAQHRILQQEKYLMQISNLSSALARLRPLILRCLVFELPDRGIQIGTTTFVSSIREPCGSIEPSVEEERLWELWRQAEALLTIMDNDSMPLTMLESRLTLSKKRAIMLAFCDWEQYSLYVQDAWDNARKGIDQPNSPADVRRSRSNSTTGGPGPGYSANSTPRESIDSSRASTGFYSPRDSRFARFSLTRQRKTRRTSVVGIAPASLQRIADEAQAVREESEQLLLLMSPLYRENHLSPQSSRSSTTNGLSTSDTAAAIAAAAAATATATATAAATAASSEIASVEIEASSITQSTSMSFSVKSCPNC
ncbi:hypothetical protein LPJ81_002430 [Coemansia sp. IMI 209127]|nr:hypothetical protein LPJ81_002430 [Coemansia sp. IMI 209127]